MGDRALIVVKDSGVAVYLHWAGDHALKYLKEAVPRMRASDPSYSAARLCGVLHDKIEGNLSLGLMAGPTEEDEANDYKDFTHGDAGVIVYDCETGKARCYAGYPAKKHKGDVNIGLPPR